MYCDLAWACHTKSPHPLEKDPFEYSLRTRQLDTNTTVSVHLHGIIETVSLEGTFCDTVQVPSGTDDMQLI